MTQGEKEEMEFKDSGTLTLCINKCGFSGNPATKNMCKKCFQAAGFLTSPPSSTSSSSCHDLHKPASIQAPDREKKPAAAGEDQPREPLDPPITSRSLKRCSCCQKKVGLIGFRCRCGDMFCSKHRYSDQHDCGYDYKAAGREKISRENPLVKAAKILRV